MELPYTTNQQQKEEVPQNTPVEVQSTPHHKKNLYPVARHILLVACILFALCLIIFLVHQNGKSIYEHGV